MTKLGGTPGQNFARLAEQNPVSGAIRHGKDRTEKATERTSFHDLLNSVSKLSRRSQQKEGEKSEPMRAIPGERAVTRIADRQEREGAIGCAGSDAIAQAETPDNFGPLPRGGDVELQGGPILSTIAGAPSDVAPGLVSPRQPSGDTQRAVPLRAERSARSSEWSSGTMTARAAATTAPQTGISPLAAPLQDATTTVAVGRETGAGFGPVAANIELAARISVRDTAGDATSVTVIRQETHLPPVSPLSAPQQVANAIVSDLQETAGSAPVTNSTAIPDKSPEQPLKILTISLDPPALGNVTVRLRLAGPDVSIHIAAERLETCRMLDQQRDSIRGMMHLAGYVAEVATVQHGTMDGLQTSSGQSQPSLSGQPQSYHSQGASDGAGASPGQSHGNAKRTHDEREPNREAFRERDQALQHPRGVVYL